MPVAGHLKLNLNRPIPVPGLGAFGVLIAVLAIGGSAMVVLHRRANA
jgi:hypothetical protein